MGNSIGEDAKRPAVRQNAGVARTEKERAWSIRAGPTASHARHLDSAKWAKWHALCFWESLGETFLWAEHG